MERLGFHYVQMDNFSLIKQIRTSTSSIHHPTQSPCVRLRHAYRTSNEIWLWLSSRHSNLGCSLENDVEIVSLWTWPPTSYAQYLIVEIRLNRDSNDSLGMADCAVSRAAFHFSRKYFIETTTGHIRKVQTWKTADEMRWGQNKTYGRQWVFIVSKIIYTNRIRIIY